MVGRSTEVDPRFCVLLSALSNGAMVVHEVNLSMYNKIAFQIIDLSVAIF
jgi:hypothetical protein